MRFKGEPQYNTKREMFISAFWCPRHTKEQFQGIKDAGINHIYIESKYGKHGTLEFMKALDLCEELGIKSISQRYDYSKPLLEDPTDYSKYTCFTGFNVYDEPNREKVDKVIYNDLVEFNKQYKNSNDINFYSNLLPHYASSKQTGFEDYADYVDYYGKTISSKIDVGEKIICVDSYPICQDEETGKNYLFEGHLFSLECVANTAKKYDLVPYFFIQDMSFGKKHRAPEQADLNLQVYTCLAFGIQGIQHFTYMTPQDEPGGEFTYDRNGVEQTSLIDRNNNKTKRWYFAKNINDELKKIQNVFLSFRWNGILPCIGEEIRTTKDFEWLRKPLKSHDRIDNIKVSSDTIIGCFVDENGYDGFMVVPYLETTLNHNPKVEITFNNANTALVYIHGEKSVKEIKNGKLALNIDSGNGVFVIPFNK